MLFTGMVATTLCDLPGVIGHSMIPKVHVSTPTSIYIEQGGFWLSVYYTDYCNLH